MTQTTTSASWRARLFAVSTLILLSTNCLAGGTHLWELAGFDELDLGKLENTTVSSLGEVTVGMSPRRLDLPEIGTVWSAVRSKDGTLYLGTGYDGKILRVKDGKATVIATTDQLVITSMAVDEKGALYAASLPDAVIWKIDDPGTIPSDKPVKAVKWATLPKETKHVWAIAFDRGYRTLFAGTGPEGKVFAIGRDASASVYAETEEDNVLCLLTDGERLIAGTSPNSLLLEIRGPGRASALADFDATEVKAIARDGDSLVVAVNKFSGPPSIPSKPAVILDAALATASKTTTKTPRMGDGFIYRLFDVGRTEKLWGNDKTHLVSLAVDSRGTVHAGLASDGKIISVDRDRLTRTEADLDEREVMVILAEDDLSFAATGDAGAAYTMEQTRPAEAYYLSPPLDAGSKATWGELSWFGEGKLQVQARTGNTLNPDRSWTDWSKNLASGKKPPVSQGRYLQLRVSWARDPKAIFRSAELAYKPLNMRAVITELNPDSPFSSVTKSTKKKADKKGPTPSTRTVVARPTKDNAMELEISWKVDNPDEDTLRYRLFYRAPGQKVWRPILKEDEIFTKTRYKWDTETVPEGRYLIRLVADDSPSNSPADTLADEYISVPVIVDNHQPRVDKLSFKGGVLSGEARDSYSAISAIDFSVDGGPWIPAGCADGIFDQLVEGFSFSLPTALSPEPHTLAVRAFDRTGNQGLAEIHVSGD